jgi:hypothetical protein
MGVGGPLGGLRSPAREDQAAAVAEEAEKQGRGRREREEERDAAEGEEPAAATDADPRRQRHQAWMRVRHCGTMRRGHRVRLGREMDKVGVLGRRWAGLLPLGPFYLSRPTFLSI